MAPAAKGDRNLVNINLRPFRAELAVNLAISVLTENNGAMRILNVADRIDAQRGSMPVVTVFPRNFIRHFAV